MSGRQPTPGRRKDAARPELTASLAEADFLRWYWTMAELQPFARALGIRAAGPKADLTGRIAARLGGRRPPPDKEAAHGPGADERGRTSGGLVGPFTGNTPIPAGQRSTQELRAWFEAEIGPSFRFNGHMRAFLKAGGATLSDAVEHWHATVGTPLPEQSDSLEFNRFTRRWHVAHPDGSAAECRAAWQRYRSLPTDRRPDVADA